MKIYIVSYVATAIVFLGIDAVWLTVMGGSFYKPLLGDLLLEKFRLAPAVIFYLIYIAGVVVFAVSPAIRTGQWTTALLYGALFGLVAYATYDLTNQATLKEWPTIVTVVDLAWGATLTAVSASLGFVIAAAITKAS